MSFSLQIKLPLTKLPYTTIYFFVKNLFFEYFYFSEYDIRMSLYSPIWKATWLWVIFWCHYEMNKIVGCWNGMYLLWGFFVERFKCGNMEWPSKKNFFINNSVGHSMYDAPIETVKYIWVNTFCSKECKNLDAVVPINCLQPTPRPLLIR